MAQIVQSIPLAILLFPVPLLGIVCGGSVKFEGQTNVGRVKLAGPVQCDSSRGSCHITGSGENMWGNEDAFFSVWRKVEGDLALKMSIEWEGKGKHPHCKAGLMIRAGLGKDGAYVDAVAHGAGLISMQFRKAKGETTNEVQSPFRAPATLLLERNGHQVTLSVMKDVEAAALAFSDFSPNPSSWHKAKIGLQLYTVRKAIERDFEGTLKRIADIGFVGIEYYPLPENIATEHAAKVFKDLKLVVLGMHTPLPVGDQRDAAVKLAEAFNCDRVIYPGWPQWEKYKNVEATNRTAETYNEVAAFLKTKGLRFGLHNHWWEVEKTDGIYPFYYLLEHLDKNTFFEIDTYWAKTGGMNPAKVVRDFGKRAPLLHIKDGPAVKGDTMYNQVPVGEGSLDFPTIVKAGGKNIEWMIVEFDEYDKDIFDGIKKSYTFLTKHGLAEGKV